MIDLSLEIENGMPTCGTPWHQEVKIQPMGTLETVGRNTHRIVVGSHSGTHMDAPYHFLGNGEKMEMLDVERMCGQVTIVDCRKYKAGAIVDAEDIKDISVTERMLFVFGWYHKWKTDLYYKEFPYFTEAAVEYLIQNGMKFMALDTPSPDDGSAIAKTDDDSPNHKKLLENGVIIVEYLTNTEILLEKEKKYEIFALPLKVVGADGCPARVVAREVK